MNVIIKHATERDTEQLAFIGDIRYFYIADDYDIVFRSKSDESVRIDADIIKNELIKHILPKKENKMYEYFRDNKHHLDNISEKIFDTLVEAYLLNKNVYIVPTVEKIIKEYFENNKEN